MSDHSIDVPPAFLKTSTQRRRENFGYLNFVESKRILGDEAKPAVSAAHGRLRSNAPRNRYNNVYPWDATRVKLPVVSSKYSDYVNASYIDFDDTSNDSYIASQGPLRATTHHFWAMAFNEAEKQNSDQVVIVMVTPLVESGDTKCFQYWPDERESMSFDRLLEQDGIDLPTLEVRHLSEAYNEEGDYLLTEMELVSGSTTKKVFHYYYYKWADAKVPPSIVPLLQLSKDVRQRQAVPIVHCSAGVGRTGTFITIDHLFNNFSSLVKSGDITDKYDPEVDPILQTVSQLRACRMMMVQTVYQYNFLYDSAQKLFDEK